MIKVIGIAICTQLISAPALAEFKDPMQPPAYAMHKFRLEKLKNKPKTTTAVKGKASQKTQPWVLSSILYSTQRQHAIINNKLVKKGDVIDGARLIGLKPDHVRLKKKGKLIVLTLRKDLKSIKKSPYGSKL